MPCDVMYQCSATRLLAVNSTQTAQVDSPSKIEDKCMRLCYSFESVLGMRLIYLAHRARCLIGHDLGIRVKPALIVM